MSVTYSGALTCPALIAAAAADHPHADAIVLPNDRVTYSALLRGARQWARILMSVGVLPGEHVGILLPNGTQFMEVLFGAMLAGAVAVPINARYRGVELAATLQDGDIVTVVTSQEDQPPLVQRLNDALPGLATAASPSRLRLAEAPALRHILIAGGGRAPGFLHAESLSLMPESAAHAELERRREFVQPEATAIILYTSGSTARPKGCLLSHAAIVHQGRLLAQRYHMTASDRIWSPLPMFHVGGISPLMAIASVGGAFLSMRKLDAAAGVAMMAAERATIAYVLFQTIIADILQIPNLADYDLSRIRIMVSNPALQPPWICEKLETLVPQAVQMGTFGMTETVAAACTHAPEDDREDRLTRLGRPLAGIDVRIVGEDGVDLPLGAVGEVWLRGPTLCSGYYRDAKNTAAALRGGWFRSGDRGSLDVRGSIMFHGRLKDVLKVGGENVGALEVETVVGRHPAVKSCAVVGVPDPRLVEVPVVYVELRPGASSTEQAIIQHCIGKLASFKLPRRVFFVTDWPMSATKIDKPELARRAALRGTHDEAP